MDDEMKDARAAWWSAVNWDHLDALTACEAWDAAERAHRTIVADIPGTAYLLAYIKDLEAERDALRADAERYRQMLFERGAMETAPCFCCGYNGPGYFQPDTHPCAAEHHAAIAREKE